MALIVVDSSVWVAKLRDLGWESVRRLDAIDETNRILVGDLVLFEVLQGARNPENAARLERYFRRFHRASMAGERIAVRAAANYRYLRQRGVTVRKMIDTIIATFCIENGHELLHQDRDFGPFVEHLGLREF